MNFVLELEKNVNGQSEIDTVEMYTDSSDTTKVLLSSKTTDPINDTGASSVSFSAGKGKFNQMFLGLNITWSVDKDSKAQLTRLAIDNGVTIKLDDLSDPSFPQLTIKNESPSATFKQGLCLKSRA